MQPSTDTPVTLHFQCKDSLGVLPRAALAGPKQLIFAGFPIEMLQACELTGVRSPDLGRTVLAVQVSQVCCLCMICSALMQCHKPLNEA